MNPGPRNCFNRFLIAAALLFFLPAGVMAQTPTMTLTSVSLTVDPQNSDGYTVQGTFDGLSFAKAQTVFLSVGQFAGELSITDFVQQPGANIFTYQDSTGLAPSWLSSLTLDLDAKTFTATATGIVLAGLPNPFAIQLGADGASACAMARVQAIDESTWQLTASDGNQNPCAIPVPPQANPPSVLINAPTDVQFQTAILPVPNLDPSTIQLFRADSNGQPFGAPLCQLQNNVAGKYSCLATFAESNPGLIPLVIQANAGTDLVLSPGFSLLVVQPVSQTDVDALTAVNDQVNSVWQDSFAAYGNSAKARAQTLGALRTLDLPGVAQLRLLEDGRSIGVLLSSGMPYMLILNRIGDAQDNAAQSSGAASLASPRPPPRVLSQESSRLGSAGKLTPSAARPLTCGSPERPIVKNNQVIVWKSPFFPEPTTATLLAQQLQGIGCPSFAVTQVDATIANATTFSNYGTVIIDSHGGNSGGDVLFLTSENADIEKDDPRWDLVHRGLIGAGSEPSLHGVDYLTLTSSFFASLPPFEKTLTFASTCFSAYGNIMSDIFAANGGAYYGFTALVKGTSTINGATVPGFSERIAPQLFDQLLKNYVTAADAYQAVDHNPLPSESLPLDKHSPRLAAQKSGFRPQGLTVKPLSQTSLFVLQPDNSQLAYLGNPVLLPPQAGSPSYPLSPGQELNLQAHLDGASSCDGAMNYHWTNTGKVGHLTPGGGGPQDDFTVTDSNATYRAGIFSQGIDTLTVDFLPDAANPPVARACSATDVADKTILHVVFDGHGTWTQTILPQYVEVFGNNFSADLSWHAAWDLVLTSNGISFPGATSTGALLEPPLPGSSLSGSTTVNARSQGSVCSGPPVVNPTHNGFTTSMVQTPRIGARYYSSRPPVSSIVQMWAETFGGDDYGLCDKNYLALVGDYGSDEPGYPAFDTKPGYVKFSIDLNEWLNQPDHSITLPVMSDLFTVPESFGIGETQVSGTLKFTSHSVNLSSAARAKSLSTSGASDKLNPK